MILRGIVLLFLSLSYLIPGAFAAMSGHGRNGYSGWVDTIGLDTTMGIVIWTIIAIWMIYPFTHTIRMYSR